jgi:CBS-domain-containing membrane protein
MQAKDVMTAKVVSVSKDTPIHEVVGLLLKYGISAVPVIDGTRQLVGMVSEGDLLRPEGTQSRGSPATLVASRCACPPWVELRRVAKPHRG